MIETLPVDPKEKKKEYMRVWRAANREKLLVYARGYNKVYYAATREENNAKSRAYHAANRPLRLVKQREYYVRNKEQSASTSRAYVQANKQKVSEYQREYRIKNREPILAQKRRYSIENRAEILESKKRRARAYYQTARGAIDVGLGNEISRSLRSGVSGGSWCGERMWCRLLGYDASNLAARFEKLFVPGMSWDLFLSGGIHIDHVVPISWFPYSSTEDQSFRDCWAIENLQPLWASENVTKHNCFAG